VPRRIRKRYAAAAAFVTAIYVSLVTSPAALAAGTLPPMPAFTTIKTWGLGLASALGGLGFVIQGGRLAVAYRQGDRSHDHISHLGHTAFGCAVIGGASGIANALTG